jgi:hypothetical protein
MSTTRNDTKNRVIQVAACNNKKFESGKKVTKYGRVAIVVAKKIWSKMEKIMS